MAFANPLAVLGLLLVVPVVILYLRRIRLRRQTVATNVLWERVLAEQPIRSAWQRWRYPASLAVQLMVLALIVAALADPQIPGPRQIVLIIDNSASMRAADVKPTRLEEAKQAAKRLIAGLRPCDRMAILSVGGTVNVCCSLTSDQAVLREALQQVEVPAGQGSTQVDAAVELAGWLLADSPGGTVKVITDGFFDGAAELAKAKGVEIVRVGRRTGNVAITRLQVRRTIPDPRRCQILVELSNFSDKPVECRLEWALDGKPLRPEPTPKQPINPQPINLAKNGRWQQVFAETITGSGRLTARLLCDDVYEADNEASRRVPPVKTHSVVLVTGGNPVLEEAIRHDRTVELSVTDRPPAEPARDTVLVFDRYLPSRLPDGPVLAVTPPGRCDLWRVGDPVAHPVVARQRLGSPLLAGVELIGASLPGARGLELDQEYHASARALLWTDDDTPLYYAIDRPAGRVLVLSGDLSAASPTFVGTLPTLMGNALDWLAGEDAGRGAEPDDEPDAEPLSSRLGGRREGDIRVPGTVGREAADLVAGRPGPPPWLLLVGLGAGLLTLEWCFYQRRWIC